MADEPLSQALRLLALTFKCLSEFPVQMQHDALHSYCRSNTYHNSYSLLRAQHYGAQVLFRSESFTFSN